MNDSASLPDVACAASAAAFFLKVAVVLIACAFAGSIKGKRR